MRLACWSSRGGSNRQQTVVHRLADVHHPTHDRRRALQVVVRRIAPDFGSCLVVETEQLEGIRTRSEVNPALGDGRRRVHVSLGVERVRFVEVPEDRQKL